jgi:hypothetical protein
MGTELRGKVQTRGERPGSSETADKMTPATPAALAENIRTVPNTVAAAPVSAVPAVSGARDTFIEPADAGGVQGLQTSIQSEQVFDLDLSGHWSRNMAKFKEECTKREVVCNKFGWPSQAEQTRQARAARLSLKAKEAAQLLLSQVPTNDNPHLAPSPLSDPTCSKIISGRANGGEDRDRCGQANCHQELESATGEHHPKQKEDSLNGCSGKGKSAAEGEVPTRNSFQWTTNSEMILIQCIKDKSFSRLGECTLNPEGCDEGSWTYLDRLRIGMKEMGLREIPTDAEICINLLKLQTTYGSDAQAFCKCERDIQQALEKETERSSSPQSSGPQLC